VTPELPVDLQEALIHHRNGRLDEAARCYEAILLACPRDFDALFYFGQVRAAQGRYQDAYALLHEAAAVRPDSAEAQYQLGALLVGLRRPHQAAVPLRAVLQRDPTHARALLALGTAFRTTGDFDDAAACFRTAIAAHPDLAEAHAALGQTLIALELPADALPLLERALALAPADAAAHAALGSALGRLGRWEDAMRQCDEALRLDPGLAEAHANAGSVLLELGDVEAAVAKFERAIALDPDNPQYLCRLAASVRFAPGDERIAALEALARDPDLPKPQRINVHFALGKAYDDAGNAEGAFEQFLRGNALKRSTIEYDETATMRAFALTSSVLTKSFVEHRRGWGFASSLPIFIVGMPRSGTTLVEQILASHPQVHAAGELPDFQRIAREVLAAGPTGGIERAAMEAATPEQIARIGEEYVRSISALAPGARRITDKMPANATYLGLVHLALPNARILRTRRDPVDTCVSCFSLLFAEGQEFAYDLAELGRYYRAYEALLDHWEAVLPPGSMLDVRYEDVVADLEGQARRILAFCDLPWDDACLRFYETKRPVKTASVVQVRQPIYTRSVGRWRKYGSRLQPLLDALA